MKKHILSAAVIMVVAGASSLGPLAWGQGQTSGAAPEKRIPHKIGLIDMAHIFKEYKKFNVLREDLKGKIEESDSIAKSKASQIKALQAELNGFTSGSPEYAKAEHELAKATSDFETYRKLKQSEFLREESQIYKTIYLEVTDMVEKYARHYEYTLIMRFSRDGLQDTDEPGSVIKGMNRQVVYFRPQDDITLEILEYLNKKYSTDGGAAAAARTTRKDGVEKGSPR